MKRLLPILLLVFGLALSTSAADRKLYHVFKFKESATKEQIKEVEDAFRDLKKKIKEIQSYEWGTNVSPEKHDKGFTHGLRFHQITAAKTTKSVATMEQPRVNSRNSKNFSHEQPCVRSTPVCQCPCDG